MIKVCPTLAIVNLLLASVSTVSFFINASILQPFWLVILLWYVFREISHRARFRVLIVPITSAHSISLHFFPLELHLVESHLVVLRFD